MSFALRPAVLALIVYLTLVCVAGILAVVMGTAPDILDALQETRAMGMSILDWLLFCNAAWMVLFLFEFPLAKSQPPAERRGRRVLAAVALLGLGVFELAVYVLATGLDAQ